jgi:hypothetical protein
MNDMAAIQAKYKGPSPRMDEAPPRIWAAVEARGLGRGGITLVAQATGVSRTTRHSGIKELETQATVLEFRSDGNPRIRAAGGER